MRKGQLWEVSWPRGGTPYHERESQELFMSMIQYSTLVKASEFHGFLKRPRALEALDRRVCRILQKIVKLMSSLTRLRGKLLHTRGIEALQRLNGEVAR